MRYIDMTADERLAAYRDQMEAVEIHIQCFAIRPMRGHGTRADRKALAHAERCEREAGFIKRVARSKGDEWANG